MSHSPAFLPIVGQYRKPRRSWLERVNASFDEALQMQCVHSLDGQAIQRQSGLIQTKLHAGDRILSHTILKTGLLVSAIVGYEEGGSSRACFLRISTYTYGCYTYFLLPILLVSCQAPINPFQ